MRENEKPREYQAKKAKTSLRAYAKTALRAWSARL